MRRQLAAYSGGTVRDFHPLPFSLVLRRAPQGAFKLTQDLSVVKSLQLYNSGRRNSARESTPAWIE